MYLGWLVIGVLACYSVHREWRRHCGRRQNWAHFDGDRIVFPSVDLLCAHFCFGPTMGHRLHFDIGERAPNSVSCGSTPDTDEPSGWMLDDPPGDGRQLGLYW